MFPSLHLGFPHLELSNGARVLPNTGSREKDLVYGGLILYRGLAYHQGHGGDAKH